MDHDPQITSQSSPPTTSKGLYEPRRSAELRVATIALTVFIADQISKLIVMRTLTFGDEWDAIPGFYKFVHWGNTGAAWSMFHDNNLALAVISGLAMLGLFLFRKHFEINTSWGRVCLGLILGGIGGNLLDRIRVGHVVDFIRFYLERPGGEVGFPAFNIADMAICGGVGLLFIRTWRTGD